MENFRYGYLLTISDDEGFLTKYDYILTNDIIFNNSAVYDYLSGVDLSRYDLNDREDNEYFSDNIATLNADYKVDKITILTDLAIDMYQFLKA